MLQRTATFENNEGGHLTFVFGFEKQEKIDLPALIKDPPRQSSSSLPNSGMQFAIPIDCRDPESQPE